MLYKVCVVTGTRADYGLLRETIKRLYKNTQIDLDLLVTGTHLSEQFGNTQDEIQKDGFFDYSVLPIPMEGDSKWAMASSTGETLVRFSNYFFKNTPDLLVVLGDRFEILAAAIAAQFCGIPIAHISGGDVTEGAVDDAIRHSITKMSQIHFPGCEQSLKRIIQMGEQPKSVFNVGEPGVENCLKTVFLTRKELAESIHFSGILNDYCIITYHPVTKKDNTGIEDIYEIVKAIDKHDDMSYIITLSNADAGGREINRLWIEECGKRKNCFIVPSMGVQRYLSSVKYASAVIGNSSSGIIEAPALGVPTINIGDRQKGRMIADSVISCAPLFEEIDMAISKALSNEFRQLSRNVISPFGDGTTSEQIEQHLLEYLHKGDFSTEKQFYDINFSESI